MHLRKINRTDLETIRLWRNKHRKWFFDSSEITVEQQERWYNSYIHKPNDYMFMIPGEKKDIGCIGIRERNGGWDVYNVIRGEKGGKGLMSMGLQNVIWFVQNFEDEPIMARVLINNPAIEWYKKNGFEIVATYDTYHLMRHV